MQRMCGFFKENLGPIVIGGGFGGMGGMLISTISAISAIRDETITGYVACLTLLILGGAGAGAGVGIGIRNFCNRLDGNTTPAVAFTS